MYIFHIEGGRSIGTPVERRCYNVEELQGYINAVTFRILLLYSYFSGSKAAYQGARRVFLFKNRWGLTQVATTQTQRSPKHFPKLPTLIRVFIDMVNHL